MKVKDFDYDLPPELIAQEPASERSESRMLVMARDTGEIRIRQFSDIAEYLHPGDCLVVNDTQVIPARLIGHRPRTDGRVEALLCEELSPGRWRALMKPGRRLKTGTQVHFGQSSDDTVMTVAKRNPDDTFEVEFNRQDVLQLLSELGEVPLPPYIRRRPDRTDRDRYQTVYSARPGAVAAPTAGLHFTPEILRAIEEKGVIAARLTLHTGPGTFKPVQEERVEDHQMHEESYQMSEETANTINRVRDAGARVLAVGTTTVRVLETLAGQQGYVRPGQGRTNIFLHPPMQPRVADGLLTNFHLPRSTLMMLVATYCGRENLLAAYRLAIREKMRFYSYGDCMLIL